MATIHKIKGLQAQGWSVSAIATALDIDRKTVRKYCTQTDFSPQPPVPAPRPSKLDPYKPTIDRWLREDAQQWYKQRHTAQRIYDRLQEEFPACGVSYPTVRRMSGSSAGPRPGPARWTYSGTPGKPKWISARSTCSRTRAGSASTFSA